MEEVEVYDVEEAARVVSERTGMEPGVVEEILEAEFLFQAALGVVEVVEDDEEGADFLEEVRQLRETHADLVPAIDTDLDALEDLDDRLVTFVSRLTGAEPATIEDVLDEHLLYLEEQGLLEPAEDED